jgi:hypothetical protein
MRTCRSMIPVVLTVVLFAGACGDDDGAKVREVGGAGSASGTGGSPSGTGGSPSGPGGSGSAVAACKPVGETSASATKLAVKLGEFSVTLGRTEVPAGQVTLEITNEGAEPHEVVVVRANRAEELTVKDGKVDEASLPAGTLIGEVEAFPAGESCEGTFELAAGNYVLFCNIVEETSGKVESHFEEGMHTTLAVT